MPDRRKTLDASRNKPDPPASVVALPAPGVRREASGARLSARSLAAVTNKEFIQVCCEVVRWTNRQTTILRVNDPGLWWKITLTHVFLVGVLAAAASMNSPNAISRGS
jgi:hypothetical protein